MNEVGARVGGDPGGAPPSSSPKAPDAIEADKSDCSSSSIRYPEAKSGKESTQVEVSGRNARNLGATRRPERVPGAWDARDQSIADCSRGNTLLMVLLPTE